MNMLKQLNSAIEYIEANLCAEFDLDTAAGIACVTADSFIRFFSYMTGMTLTEYIRRRRLTLAAQDLQHSKTPIIDIAIKYGYDSAAAFSRAFAKQHGITPSVYRKDGGSLKVYSPASFHIMIKGAKEMDFRIIALADTVVYGVSFRLDWVVLMDELTLFSALSRPVVSPPISTVMPLILLAKLRHLLKNGHENSPDFSEHEKSTGC